MLKDLELQINYLNENAEEKEIKTEIFNTVFQHELDHLFGFLHVDKQFTKDLVLKKS